MPFLNLPAIAQATPNYAGPSDWEQLQLELINRARANPLAEAARQGTSLGPGVSEEASQPLAPNAELDLAAFGHSQDMLAQNFFAHTNPNTSKSPFTRMLDAGYVYNAAAENISWIGAFSDPFTAARITQHHVNLWNSLSHRQAFMDDTYREVGLGFDTGSYTYQGRTYSNSSMMTQNFGDRGLTYLTGVIIDDVDENVFYSIGEGQANVNITATMDGQSWSTTSFASGGYALALAEGTYVVRFSGGDLEGFFETSVTIAGRNVKLDVIEDRDAMPMAFSPDNSDLPEMAADRDGYNASDTAEKVSLSAGEARVIGQARELDGDELFGFGTDDRITFTNSAFGKGQISFDRSTGDLSVNTSGDSAPEATMSLFGNFANLDLLVFRDGTGTHIAARPTIAQLREHGRIDTSQINANVASEYLQGANAGTFNVSVDAATGAKFANSVGVYEITSDGRMVDVDIIAANAKTAGSMTVSGVDAGNELAFFIIQNGFNTVAGDVLASDDLAFATIDGTVRLTDGGRLVDGATVFVSHDADLNPDSAIHAASGLARDGSGAVLMGFEDLMRSGGSDDDFQDVLLRIEAEFNFV